MKDRIEKQDQSFMVYALGDKLESIALAAEKPKSVDFEGVKLAIKDQELTLNDQTVTHGLHTIDDKDYLITASQKTRDHYLVLGKDEFTVGQDDKNNLKSLEQSSIVITRGLDDKLKALIMPENNEWVYFNQEKITTNSVRDFEVGHVLLSPSFFIQRRKNQWQVTTFTDKLSFNDHNFLFVHKEEERPLDFPEYRRSPRLNLELPEGDYKYDKIPEPENASKSEIIKTILPPVFMLGASAVTSTMSGGNPMMMMGMGAASLLTATFSITQYRTEKKDRKVNEESRLEDYQAYLFKSTAPLGRAYAKEKEVLDFQQPSPEQLLEHLRNYDSHLYERMVNHKDFMQVSLGIGDKPSNLKIASDYESRDEDDWARHVKGLVERFQTQRDVPVVMDLKAQTLGLIAPYDLAHDMVAQLLLQIAFFQSYRDINFVSLVPERYYESDWAAWRLMPHFMMSGINVLGMVHHAKSRDMVLSSFYQLLKSRKQELENAGREKPTFLPHYVLTIMDDSYLAGHGLNEFLAEDMSDLGVTVIWVKEDKKLLPETTTALVEVNNAKTGVLLQDNNVNLGQVFKPYPAFEDKADFELGLRVFTSLTHMEVEKNAIPERLSLLEQYQVQSVEDLKIAENWAHAQPNKTLKSMIGWKGFKEPAFWDLHEQVHGPHAIVGGTSGSGKSEFLTTYLMGLAINFSPEDVGMLIIDWKGGGIANTLSDLPHFMGAITNLDGAGIARALASINAELKKRQSLFNDYGVNNISGYTKLYKERKAPREGIKYPTEALPHLFLVSDEFAELKENVPEFLTELTSVARIGRSLGVHLILATQKPDGVVNDQIDANSKSKLALKMSDEANSKALIKTGDAAHITNPGRGYLRVGESEVYELFQSGYAGVDYNPHEEKTETIDERIYMANDLVQYELIYDPNEEVVDQSQSKEELDSQLEAVIKHINAVQSQTDYQLPKNHGCLTCQKASRHQKFSLQKREISKCRWVFWIFQASRNKPSMTLT